MQRLTHGVFLQISVIWEVNLLHIIPEERTMQTDKEKKQDNSELSRWCQEFSSSEDSQIFTSVFKILIEWPSVGTCIL